MLFEVYAAGEPRVIKMVAGDTGAVAQGEYTFLMVSRLETIHARIWVTPSSGAVCGAHPKSRCARRVSLV